MRRTRESGFKASEPEKDQNKLSWKNMSAEGAGQARPVKKGENQSVNQSPGKMTKSNKDLQDSQAKLSEDEEQHRRQNITQDQIISESKSNKHIIYKFMRKGFQALTAEELACTMVNPTFSIDFKKNANEDWQINYQAKVVEKLQRCKFHMHWFVKQTSAKGYDDAHETFMSLVAHGDIEKCLQYLRNNDAEKVLSAVEKNSKRSPLHIAAKFGNINLIEFLLNKGANVIARDKHLKTPLHYACENGHIEAVALLLKENSDPFLRDNCGRTTLHYAIYSGQTALITLLNAHHTDLIHEKDHAGRSPLHHAVFMEANQVKICQKLIDFGADVNSLDSDRRTPLHHAAESGQVKVIKTLITNGAHTFLKDNLTNKTPLELAKHDHIRELIIAYTAPEYIIDADDIDGKQPSFKKNDIRVNRKGQIVNDKEFDPPLESPDIRSYGSLARPSKKKKRVKIEEVQKKVEVKPATVVAEQPAVVVCPNCQCTKGLGPVDQWEKQQEKFIPYNMKNYQERLLGLLRRIQKFGVDSFIFQKKPYLYTGSWMEHVRNMDDLMVQINAVEPNEACMKMFNVLFPYPEPLPIGKGDEQALSGFFDGMTKVDKEKANRDCLPEELQMRLQSKNNDKKDDILNKGQFQDVQDLLNTREEVMTLRSANNALEFMVQQKDDLIQELEQKLGAQERENRQGDKQQENNYVRLQAQNTVLADKLNDLEKTNKDLEERVKSLTVKLENSVKNQQDPSVMKSATRLAEQLEQKVKELEELQAKYDMVDGKNKELRFKAGQVFLQCISSGVSLDKTSVKGGNDQAFLEDLKAVERMFEIIEAQEQGSLKQRLLRVTYGSTSIISQQQFTNFVKDELSMTESELLGLIKVAKFTELKTQMKTLPIDQVKKNLDDRLAQSDKMQKDCIKKIATLMKKEGLNLKTAMRYFDMDKSGTITTSELIDGFSMMKVTLNQSLIRNIFFILDKSGDNIIDLHEFENVFSPYFASGAAVQEVKAEDIQGDVIDEETAKDLAKQMKEYQDQKKKINYDDLKLESLDLKDIEDIEEIRVNQIKAGQIESQKIAGELFLKIGRGSNLPQLKNGKDKFAFQIFMPNYEESSGKLKNTKVGVQFCHQNPETKKFDIRVRWPIPFKNMFLYKETIKIQIYKLSDQDEENIKTADLTFIGTILIPWKECVKAEGAEQLKFLPWIEELRDPDGMATMDISGAITGELQWIKFGHEKSKFKEDGSKKEEPKAQKTTKDFQGKKVGEAGTLQVMPMKYTHSEDLDVENEFNYQVSWTLKNSNGEEVGKSLSKTTNKAIREKAKDKRLLTWSDIKDLAITNTEEDVELHVVVQTEQQSTFAGKPVASGMVNLKQIEMYTQKNQAGQYHKAVAIQLIEAESGKKTELVVRLKYKPAAAAKPEDSKEVVPAIQEKKEEVKQSTFTMPKDDDNSFAIPKDDEPSGDERVSPEKEDKNTKEEDDDDNIDQEDYSDEFD